MISRYASIASPLEILAGIVESDCSNCSKDLGHQQYLAHGAAECNSYCTPLAVA